MVFEPKTWYIAFQNCHLTHCITDSNVNKNRTAGGSQESSDFHRKTLKIT
nr:MAG TPA: hypothetical protein [Caudoviricetes sp.]